MRARFWILLLLGLPIAGALGYLAAERAAPPVAPAPASGAVTAREPAPRLPEHERPETPRPAVPAPGDAERTHAEFEAARADRSDGAPERLRLAYVHWVVADPSAALAHAGELPEDERHALVAAGLTLLAQDRPEEALEALGNVDGDFTPYLADALGEIARKDPRRALEWLEKNRERDPNGDLAGAIIPSLAGADLSRAAQLVESLGDRAPEAAVQAVAAEYARRDPARAYAWAGEMAAARHDDPAEGRRAVSAALVAEDPGRATQVLAGATDPAVRASLIAEISQQRGQQDLNGAWDWLGQFKDEPSYGENARGLLSRWTYTQPQAVADLLPAVTDPELQASAARELAKAWQQQDPVRYGAWVATLPPGPLKAAATEER
ncbi:MAG TPA: hypothetical protein VMR86_11190 [Myxococcota bacterium]|nr:hypothetical protein [Myxococcota bacterium]